MNDSSTQIEHWLKQMQAGDDRACNELIERTCKRLRRLTRKILKDYSRLKRWEETDDVLQNASLRIWRAVQIVKPASALDYFRLSAWHIRRELLDLARHYYGPQGLGAQHASQGSAAHGPVEPSDRTADPSRLQFWTEFHEQVEALPDEERAVFDLLWYQELTQVEAGLLLGVSERTVKRRWQSARLQLHQKLYGAAESAADQRGEE